MRINELFPSKYLRAADLQGKPRLGVIEAVRTESIVEGEEPKPVVDIIGVEPGLVLNKTNGNTIASFLGDDTDEWVGHQIVLFPSTTDFQGKTVACIRVRAPKTRAAAPAQPAPVKKPAAPAPAAFQPEPEPANEPQENSLDVPF